MRSDLKSLKAKKLISDLFGVCIKEAASAKTTRIGADGGQGRSKMFFVRFRNEAGTLPEEGQYGRELCDSGEETATDVKGLLMRGSLAGRKRRLRRLDSGERVGRPLGIREVDGLSRGEEAAGRKTTWSPGRTVAWRGSGTDRACTFQS